MIKFSEFYGPERQRELLQEAKNQRFNQHNCSSKEENKMYSKISVALIIVGLLVAGFGVFNNSVAQAAPPCGVYADSAQLAANPELLKISCREVTVKAETNVQRAFAASAARYSAMAEYYARTDSNVQRANEASSARYSGLAKLYTGATGETDSSYQAANPELGVASRYGALEQMTGSPSLVANPELMIVNRYTAQAK